MSNSRPSKLSRTSARPRSEQWRREVGLILMSRLSGGRLEGLAVVERSPRASRRPFAPPQHEGFYWMTTLFTILFDGVAYGMLLFVLACGLAVTLGLMNFVNLAHGAFAMAGGYICAVLVNQYGWPFFAGLPLAF